MFYVLTLTVIGENADYSEKSLTYFRLTQTERGGRETDRDGQTDRDEIQRQTIRQRQRQRDDTDMVCDMNSASDTHNTVLAIHCIQPAPVPGACCTSN